MKQSKEIQRYSRLMYLGFFLIFPILFFGNQLKQTMWFNVFGILALIGAGIELYYFIKIIRAKKTKERVRKKK